MLVGEMIKHVRKSQGLSSTELAKKMGTSQSAISFIETNKRIPSDLTLRKFSECLDINYNNLLTCKKESVVSNDSIETIDLLQAHKINTIIINSKIGGRCFLCGRKLNLEGLKLDNYILSCKCGLKLSIPINEDK